jgi:hypothetical protein
MADSMVLNKNIENMKIQHFTMAENLLIGLIPHFKGLSEKSAKKMINKLDITAFNLSKEFFKLQEKDYERCMKLEEKIIKKQKKAVKKAANKSKIAMMLGTNKPKNLIAIPEKTATTAKKPLKKPFKKADKIKIS